MRASLKSESSGVLETKLCLKGPDLITCWLRGDGLRTILYAQGQVIRDLPAVGPVDVGKFCLFSMFYVSPSFLAMDKFIFAGNDE